MSADFSHPHPQKCHWSYGLPGICGKPTKVSAYYNTPNARQDLIANLCDEHSQQMIIEKINCTLKDRWTGKEIYRR